MSTPLEPDAEAAPPPSRARPAAAATAAATAPHLLEPQLLDYTTHQAKLLPLVATAFAFTAASARMRGMYEALLAGLASADMSALPDVHATSSGMKVRGVRHGARSARASV